MVVEVMVAIMVVVMVVAMQSPSPSPTHASAPLSPSPPAMQFEDDALARSLEQKISPSIGKKGNTYLCPFPALMPS